ncbi:hypothetical protein GCM10028807_57710 [Spirosoma daeguense]
MAFATKYRFEYQEAYGESLSYTSNYFRVSFLFPDYQGDIITLLAGGSPIKNKTLEGSDTFLQPLAPLMRTFSLACQNYWEAMDFSVQGDRDILVLIEKRVQNTNAFDTYFVGWVVSADIKEPYGPKPYLVQITARDGLKSLTSRPFLDENGQRIKGQISLSHAIRLALSYTGLFLPGYAEPGLSLVVGYNLYSAQDLSFANLVNGKANPALCPLYQAMVDGEWFLNENNAVYSCYDVLTRILGALPGVRLAQQDGEWWLIRTTEMAGGWDANNILGPTIRTRQYHDSDLSAPPSGNASRRLDLIITPGFDTRVREGGSQWLPAIAPGVKIEQKFGGYKSKIPNGDLAQVDNTQLPVGWVSSMANGDRFRTGNGTNESPYAIRLVGYTNEKIAYGDYFVNGFGEQPWVAFAIDFNTNSVDYTKFNTRELRFESQLHDVRAAKVYAKVFRDDGDYFQVVEGLIRADKISYDELVARRFGEPYFDTSNIMRSKPGWNSYTFDLGTLDRVSRIEFYLCAGESLDAPGGGPYPGTPGNRPWVEYRNLQLVSKKSGLVLDGTQQTIAKDKQEIKNATATVYLGDIPDAASPYDRIGTLLHRHVSGTPVTSGLRYRPDANILAPNPTGKDIGRTLLSWITRTHANQTMYPAMVFEGTLVGRLPYGLFTVVYINDIGVRVGNNFRPYPLIIAQCDSDERLMMHRVTLIRLMPDNPSLPDTLKEWQSPEGILPMNEGKDGEVVEPPNNTLPSTPLGDFFKNLYKSGVRPTFTGRPSVPNFNPVQGPAKFKGRVEVNGVVVGKVIANLKKLIPGL